MNEPADRDRHGWRKEGRDLLRAIAGGSIVGMPLLYTMEMWQHGMSVSEVHLLALLAAILVVNFAFCFLSGFRRECSFGGAIMESITSVGIAVVYSALILWLIGELKVALSLAEMMGKILLEAAAVSVGISFAAAQIEGRSRTGEAGAQDEDRDTCERDQDAGEDKPERDQDDSEQDNPFTAGDRQLKADLREFAAAVAGSSVFALNVAPTEEITLIAGRLSPPQLLALLIASGCLCYVILFASQFRQHQVHVESAFQHPIAETVLTCAVSLCVAAALLLLLGDRSILSHPTTAVASIVTLGLPAIVGGAAGRLIA